MKSKLSIFDKFISYIFIFSIMGLGIVNCGKSSKQETKINKPPNNEEIKKDGDIDEEIKTGNDIGAETDNSQINDNSQNPQDSQTVFESNQCNRFYWTFKCALEYKTTENHSEECKRNIANVYPNNKDALKMISAQSKNPENTKKQTWKNFFNQNCKDDVSVTANLKNLN